MSPLIGIFHSEDGINGALAYGLEMDLNYLVTGASATFLDNINTNKYECSFKQKNLQWHIMFHVGYAFSDDITLCVETGFGKLLSVGSQCVIKENGIETLRQKEGWAILSNLETAFTIPIALRGTYFITDNLFIKGTLNFNMININLFGEDLGADIKKATTLGVFNVNQNNSVTYANDWKAVSFILSFGYEWNR